MKEEGKFDFIISLGDMADHGNFRDSGHDIVAENQYIYDTLLEYFPDVQILPALGNHETEPIEFFEFGSSNFTTENILPLYKAFITQEKIDDFIQKGFYEIELEQYNLKVISWNTQFIDIFNMPLVKNLNLANDLVLSIGDSLFESEKKNQKVLIIQHIPLGDQYADDSKAVRCLKFVFQRFRNTLVGILGGHSHYDSFNLFRDREGEIYVKQFVSPSLTTFGVRNQSFRIYHFENSQISDYDQYRFDLDKYNSFADQGDLRFHFDLKYSFLSEYEMTDFADSKQWVSLEQKLDHEVSWQ